MKYIVFDGAQLESAEIAYLRERDDCHALYADMGDEAAAVGPWLAPAKGEIDALAAAVEASRPRRYGIIRLLGDVDSVRLTGHLSRLRYLYGDDEQRYFFRFADSRAFDNVWRALDPAQKAGLFGPVVEWAYTNRSGRHTVRTAPDGIEPQQPPWRLTEAQFNTVLDLSWPDQLLAATLERELDLMVLHREVEYYAWTQRTCELARTLAIDSHPLHLAMNTAVLRTAGHAFDDPAFKAAVAKAQAGHSPEPIDAWLAGPGARFIRLP